MRLESRSKSLEGLSDALQASDFLFSFVLCDVLSSPRTCHIKNATVILIHYGGKIYGGSKTPRQGL